MKHQKALPPRFQLIIDTDSVFMSPAPGGRTMRVILSHIPDSQVASIREQLYDSGVVDEDRAFTIPLFEDTGQENAVPVGGHQDDVDQAGKERKGR